MLSTEELTWMRENYDASLMDTCEILDVTEESWDSPESVSVVTTVACGFEPMSGREVMGRTEVEEPDGRARFSIDNEAYLTKNRRVRVTHRYGEAWGIDADRRTYDIVSVPQRGPAGVVVDLELTT